MAKSFAWSFSKLKNFETCPKKYYEVDVAKNYREDTAQLDWGNKLHSSFSTAISGAAPLPADMADYQHWVDKARKLAKPGEKILVEQKLAITKNFSPTSYFAPNAWLRVIIDLLVLGVDTAIMWDWKTGKVKHDSVQLMLCTQAVFSHHPNIIRARTGFVWLAEDTMTPDSFTRASLTQEWQPVLQRVDALEQAHKTLSFPPNPSGLCRSHCPVTSCQFHGKGKY